MAEYRTPPKNKKSLSERLKGHFSQDAPTDREEKEKIKALAEEIGQKQFSTIARVMSEGRGSSSGVQSRGTTAVYRILEEVEDHPGCDIHELARFLGEKSIFVLSHVDELVREGLLVRLEDGNLYRSRDIYQAELTALEGENSRIGKDKGQRAIEQREQARIFLRVFRYLTSEMGVEPECKDKLIVRMGKGKFFELKVLRGLGNISFFGIYSGDLLERFKKNVKIDRSRINYSRMTGILDIRGCTAQEIENVLPWVKEFYKIVKSQ